MSKLDRDMIIDTALVMFTEDGESALAMRPLATRLGVTPMALYRHFSDRDALLLALVARVSEDIDLPAQIGSPRERAAALALRLHDFLADHPWMIRLIATGRLASPAGLRFPDGFLGCASDAGLDDEHAFAFYRTMFTSILGQATITAARRQQSGPAALPVGADGVAVAHITRLAPRWNELDDAITPTAVFAAIASMLPTA